MPTELWVTRDNLRQTKIVESAAQPLEDGQIRAQIDKMGLTANNVTYAAIGERIGYWKYFPAQGDWGKVPGWGMADVVESKDENIAAGERLYGFFPMASEVILTPGKTNARTFMDATAHRKELPAVYNQYSRTQDEPDPLSALENERCLMFPLFMTAYMLYDYLIDNNFFGAQQIVIGSVSSKTGFGLARLLKQDGNITQKIVGITSPANTGFVESLACCDQIVTYGNEAEIDAALKTAWVDMSGDGQLTNTLHNMMGSNMVESCIVGGTHWESERERSETLPGAQPTFFFAPGHIGKRNQELGEGVLFEKASIASAQTAKAIQGKIAIEEVSGAQNVADIWGQMLDNKVSPARGIIVSI